MISYRAGYQDPGHPKNPAMIGNPKNPNIASLEGPIGYQDLESLKSKYFASSACLRACTVLQFNFMQVC